MLCLLPYVYRLEKPLKLLLIEYTQFVLLIDLLTLTEFESQKYWFFYLNIHSYLDTIKQIRVNIQIKQQITESNHSLKK